MVEIKIKKNYKFFNPMYFISPDYTVRQKFFYFLETIKVKKKNKENIYIYFYLHKKKCLNKNPFLSVPTDNRQTKIISISKNIPISEFDKFHPIITLIFPKIFSSSGDLLFYILCDKDNKNNFFLNIFS